MIAKFNLLKTLSMSSDDAKMYLLEHLQCVNELFRMVLNTGATIVVSRKNLLQPELLV